MKAQNFALAILAALGVAACGSSGGGSSSSTNVKSTSQSTTTKQSTQTSIVQPGKTAPAKTATTQPTKTTTTTAQPSTEPAKATQPTQPAQPSIEPAKPIISAQPAAPAVVAPVAPSASATMEEKQVESAYTKNHSVVGGGFTVEHGEYLKPAALDGEVTELNKIKVGDKVIDVIPLMSDLPQDYYSNLNEKNVKQMGGKNEYTSWGLLYDEALDEKMQYLMSEGKNPTKDMPTTGTVRYQGTAVHGYKTADRSYAYEKGVVDLTADFANKTLKGSIKANNLETIELAANITKNTFTGKHNDVKVEGGFFGDNASEVTGRYREQRQDGSDSFGVFGAKK